MKKPDKHQTRREKADSDTERSTEKWFAVLLEENHLQYAPESSVILVSVLGQRELLQLSHPDQSWFQGSMAADLLARDLPWEYWWKDKVTSSEDSNKHPCQETRKRMDQKPAWVKAELKWSQQGVPPKHHRNLENPDYALNWLHLFPPMLVRHGTTEMQKKYHSGNPRMGMRSETLTHSFLCSMKHMVLALPYS